MKEPIVRSVQPAFPGLTLKEGAEGKERLVVSTLAERSLVVEIETVPLDGFKSVYKGPLSEWLRIKKLFLEYGEYLSAPFASAILYACEDEKLPWCLSLLEKHLEEDLSFQHPDLRGRLVIAPATHNRSHIFILNEIIRVLRPNLFV